MRHRERTGPPSSGFWSICSSLPHTPRVLELGCWGACHKSPRKKLPKGIMQWIKYSLNIRLTFFFFLLKQATGGRGYQTLPYIHLQILVKNDSPYSSPLSILPCPCQSPSVALSFLNPLWYSVTSCFEFRKSKANCQCRLCWFCKGLNGELTLRFLIFPLRTLYEVGTVIAPFYWWEHWGSGSIGTPAESLSSKCQY